MLKRLKIGICGKVWRSFHSPEKGEGRYILPLDIRRLRTESSVFQGGFELYFKNIWCLLIKDDVMNYFDDVFEAKKKLELKLISKISITSKS